MPPADGLQSHRSLEKRYADLAAGGRLSMDAGQVEVARALDALLEEIVHRRMAAKKSSLGWLFARRSPRQPVKGLYIHGSVGRGKTMLMDMFFDIVPAERKRRAHFNVFMADVHDRIHRHRQAFKRGETKESDPVGPVAKALAAEAWILCFDEFSVTDIADAMILSRLFQALFAEGVVLVATSNVAPEHLYRDGLNRGLFEPFIAILRRHVRVINLDSATDYRMRANERLSVYVTPLGDEARQAMDRAWAAAAAGQAGEPFEIPLKGRTIYVPKAAGRSARFSFADLCGRPLAARDYLAIADAFDTILIDDIPVMKAAQRNEAKRFILLIDTLYDRGKKLIASAAAAPDRLYAGTTGNEAFEFARTASRLIEMQRTDWPPAPDAMVKEAQKVRADAKN